MVSMKVTLQYEDGSRSDQFHVSEIDYQGDVATLDGILHTDVAGLSVVTE